MKACTNMSSLGAHQQGSTLSKPLENSIVDLEPLCLWCPPQQTQGQDLRFSQSHSLSCCHQLAMEAVPLLYVTNEGPCPSLSWHLTSLTMSPREAPLAGAFIGLHPRAAGAPILAWIGFLGAGVASEGGDLNGAADVLLLQHRNPLDGDLAGRSKRKHKSAFTNPSLYGAGGRTETNILMGKMSISPQPVFSCDVPQVLPLFNHLCPPNAHGSISHGQPTPRLILAVLQRYQY